MDNYPLQTEQVGFGFRSRNKALSHAQPGRAPRALADGIRRVYRIPALSHAQPGRAPRALAVGIRRMPNQKRRLRNANIPEASLPLCRMAQSLFIFASVRLNLNRFV